MKERVKAYVEDKETSYWSNFYEQHDFSNGSTFFEFLSKLPELPRTIIDIGCGQGRDSFAFAKTGKQVLGIDKSDVGVSNASDRALAENLGDRLSFAACDVSEVNDVQAALANARESANNGELCYYMRFFLHSIPEESQQTLLTVIAADARPGDVFAVEFRTDKDEDHTRTFGDTHYRRYQNADDFSKQLRDRYGWEIVFETEGQGLSPYGEEDPTLYRAVAVYPAEA